MGATGATYSKSMLAEQSFCSMWQRDAGDTARVNACVPARGDINYRVDNWIYLSYYFQ
ncbi:hypothetical protein D1BOALGB6SA_9067 [Olavius sp. associated proteobacterium Delta 1]|nr:hypothetical protein D1BOALGB6SA_9067 [Olavius sp. associated proteobacterium Delta 1]